MSEEMQNAAIEEAVKEPQVNKDEKKVRSSCSIL
jgi:hypothetical protein